MQESIKEVVHTFIEAVVLVVLVVFLFLQSFRATIIPILAVPVSIIGAFIGMTALGFSINMLTLFGMVLAIGIVVDDAIVVVENVERNMARVRISRRRRPPRRRWTKSAARWSRSCWCCARCSSRWPSSSGITGQLYKQFAITIAVSVVISGVVALTLSPALCGDPAQAARAAARRRASSAGSTGSSSA